jgi:methyl-accepting chemotaxis protein
MTTSNTANSDVDGGGRSVSSSLRFLLLAILASSVSCGVLLTLTLVNYQSSGVTGVVLLFICLGIATFMSIRLHNNTRKLCADYELTTYDKRASHSRTEQDTLQGIYREALDNSNANIMIADQDNRIIYMNRAVSELFLQHDSEIRKQIPDFNASSLLGKSMDTFHKNPEHQKALINSLTETYASSAVIADITFSIIASPIRDETGERRGTVVEWSDITQEIAARNQADENNRLRQALDCASANIMVADSDNVIIYMNDTARSMFTIAEDDIREELSEFAVDNLLGQSMDVFHKDPSHQRQLINNLSSTYVAPQARVGNRTFRITASPIFNEKNARLGTVVEWEDISAELAVEHEVNSIIESARNGELGKRISTGKMQGFLKTLGEGINELVSVSDNFVKDIGAILAALAQGDLRKRMSNEYTGDFQRLKDNANETVQRLIEVIGDIQSTSNSVATGADEISKGNLNLSQRTEEQSASLEETAASMEQMTATVQQTAENARQANALAGSAQEKAQLGGDVVNQAISAMDEISTASREIEAIISVIDEIAHQTNLLALNASVEAARAGEQGRGFAVVADEVRTLAGRSAEAAKEIKDLIENSTTKVDDGSRLVHSSGETLRAIIDAAGKVTTIVREIAEASTEQAGGIEEVNRAINQMDEITQQNAALVEEASAAAQSMSDQASSLSRLISFFKMP